MNDTPIANKLTKFMVEYLKKTTFIKGEFDKEGKVKIYDIFTHTPYPISFL